MAVKLQIVMQIAHCIIGSLQGVIDISFCTKVAYIITIDQKLQLQLGSFLSVDTGIN